MNRKLFQAILITEEIFKKILSQKLNLEQIKGPIILEKGNGLNDDLSGTEAPLTFSYQQTEYEVVQSLAKWKRMALSKYGFQHGEGLFVEMNAIRPHEHELSKYHSLHVDQYDWEKVINKEERNLKFLQAEVRKIFQALKETKLKLNQKYSFLKFALPEKITFISSHELKQTYPQLDPEAREKAVAKKFKAIFILQIGDTFADGTKHGLRAADYDDWLLNGDLLVWDHLNQDVIELSSMGIRVDHQSLTKQLKCSNQEWKATLPFHKQILDQTLPLSIGGGIGRSRVNMFLLERKNINEVK